MATKFQFSATNITRKHIVGPVEPGPAGKHAQVITFSNPTNYLQIVIRGDGSDEVDVGIIGGHNVATWEVAESRKDEIEKLIELATTSTYCFIVVGEKNGAFSVKMETGSMPVAKTKTDE